LVAFTRKCPFGLLAQLVAPAVEHALGHAQVTSDLRHRLVAMLTQADRFHLEFTGKDALFRRLRCFV
jgi:hypothetical protein